MKMSKLFLWPYKIYAQGSRTPSLLIILTLYLGCISEKENYTHPRSIQDAYAMFTMPCGWERNGNLNWLAMWDNLAVGGILQLGQKWGTQFPRVNGLAGWGMPGRACMCSSQVVSFISTHKWLFSVGNKKLTSLWSGEGGLNSNTAERHTWRLLSTTTASQCSALMQPKLWKSCLLLPSKESVNESHKSRKIQRHKSFSFSCHVCDEGEKAWAKLSQSDFLALHILRSNSL